MAMPGKFWERVVIRKRGNANPMAALSEKLGVTQMGAGSVNIEVNTDDAPGAVSVESIVAWLDEAKTSFELLMNKLMLTDITSNKSIR